jgi:TRAP-type C4-dicarboxylate transport system permease small subunit
VSEAQLSDSKIPSDNRFSSALHWSLGGLSAVTLFALALITFVDVIARYVFNSPIPGAYEVSELIMGVMIFSALPVVTWRGSHITIDLLDRAIPSPIIPLRNVLLSLVSVAVLALLASELWGLANTLASYGDVTEFLRIPIHPTLQAMSLLAWFSCLLAFLSGGLALRSFFRQLRS